MKYNSNLFYSQHKKTFIFLLIVHVVCNHFEVVGQSSLSGTFAYPLLIKYVECHSPSGTASGWIRLLDDAAVTTGNPLEEDDYISGTLSTKVWDNLGNEIRPAAYWSGTTPRIKALIGVNCTAGNKYVRGVCSSGFVLSPSLLTASGNDGLYDGVFTTAFPSQMPRFWKDFQITWYVSDNLSLPYNHWAVIGTTSFPLYVTYSEPLLGINPSDPEQVQPTYPLLTSIHRSCQQASMVQTPITPVKIMNEIFSGFTNRCVKRVDLEGEDIGNCLSYQLLMEVNCNNVSDLYQIGDAQCNEWAHLLTDMIRLQGIADSRLVDVKPDPISTISAAVQNTFMTDVNSFFMNCTPTRKIDLQMGIYVKNWDFNTTNRFSVLKDEPLVPLCNGKVLSDRDINGIPAQGGMSNLDPVATFLDHVLIKNLLSGHYYDPSYGTSAATAAVWKTNALAGIGTRCRVTFIHSSGILSEESLLWMYLPGQLNVTITP